MAVTPIPEGYHSVTPYLTVSDPGALIDFVKQAFGAEEILRMERADGSIGHAEVRIGDSVVMLGGANEQWGAMPGMVHLYLEDVDAAYQRALEAGAESVQEVADQFYGDRSGGVRDRLGNVWWIATHVEDVPEDEMARRAEEWAKESQG
jgi:PhnB protein